MNPKQSTNVVYAMLPCADDWDQCLEVMRAFGEIGGVNMVENGFGLLEVAYYDIRCAQKAIKLLGDTKCWEAAPCGNRYVQLPGSAGLDKSVIDKINDIRSEDSGSYVLEFFDIRDAVSYRELQAQGLLTPAPEEKTTVAPGPPPGSFELLVTGLPNEMLTDAMMQAILEQAGISEDVLSYTVKDGDGHSGPQNGAAVLVIASRGGAERCWRHFNSCCWGAAATLLAAHPFENSSAEDETQLESAEALMQEFNDTDEVLLRQMEAREDYERGDDRSNEETFGECARSTWSFQEQVAANALLSHLPTSIKEVEEEGSTDVSSLKSESDDETVKAKIAADTSLFMAAHSQLGLC